MTNETIKVNELDTELDIAFYQNEMNRRGHKHLFLLYRHAETNQNAGKVFQGAGLRYDPETKSNMIDQKCNYPLSENGRQQAQKAAGYCQKIVPDFIFCSPLKRAVETCNILRIQNRWQQEVQTLFDLHEVQVGYFEGQSKPLMAEIYPQDYEKWRAYDDASLDFSLHGDKGQHIPDGESKREAAERFQCALKSMSDTAKENKGAVIVAVTHGAVMRWYLRVCHGLNVKKVPLGSPLIVSGDGKEDYTVLGIGNTTIYEMKGEPVPAFSCAKQEKRQSSVLRGRSTLSLS